MLTSAVFISGLRTHLCPLSALIRSTNNSTFSLLPALECYSCESDSDNDECVGNQTEATCQGDANQCAKGFIQSEDNKVKVYVKGCMSSKDCDIHRKKCEEYNGADNMCDISCCEGDLCNVGDIERKAYISCGSSLARNSNFCVV